MSMLPDEVLLSLTESIPCRELQIRQVSSLLSIASPSTVVVHGVEATGKSLAIRAILEALDTPYAVVQSQECITTRHLLERAITSIQDAFTGQGMVGGEAIGVGRCESISAFVVELQQILEGRGRFTLVFDGIDRQREATPTLLPALARLGETIPNLTTVLITTVLSPHLLHHSFLPHIHFPPYTRAETLSILSKEPASIADLPLSSQDDDHDNEQAINHEDSVWLWTRFTAAVWDSLGQSAARDIVSFSEVCSRLWLPFTQPITEGHYGVREFSKLMVRNRALFQSEASLVDSIVRVTPTAPDVKTTKSTTHTLPYYPAHLLISAYLASHNHPRHDITLFSKTSLAKRRKKGGGTALTTHRTSKHRKISRKLLGPQAFPLERLLAIFHSILTHDAKGGGADVMCMVATLAGLRLVIRAGAGGDVLEGWGKWRCNVGWDFVNNVARGVKFDLESYLVE